VVAYPSFNIGTQPAKRQPDILLPLFDPPYTVHSGTTFKFQPGSLWPLFEDTDEWDHSGSFPFVGGKFFAFGPFTSGVLTAGSTGGGAGGFSTLYGNVLFVLPNNVGSQTQDGYGWKAPLASDGVFSRPTSPNVQIWAAKPVDFTGPLSPKIVCSKADYNLVPPRTIPFVLDVGYGPFTGFYTYTLVINSIIFPYQPGVVSGNGYTGAVPGGSQNWAPVNGVPDFKHNVNYWLFNPTGTGPWYVGLWDFDAPIGGGFSYVNKVIFDDATISALFAGASTQATNFGFLMVGGGSPYFVGQASNIALVSPDFLRYAMIKLLPQSLLTSAAVTGIASPQVHLDPDGVFYMHDFTNLTVRVFNSFSLNLKWSPVLLPANAIQPIALPKLCGCMPYVPNTSKL